MSRWIAFVSYTTREAEVKAVKPLVDSYIRELERNAIAVAQISPVFYDCIYIREPLEDPDLELRLRKAIEQSHFMAAFLSPGYIQSRWCRYEWNCMTSREDATVRRVLPLHWKPSLAEPLSPWPDFQSDVNSRAWVDLTRPNIDRLNYAVESTIAFIQQSEQNW